MTRWQRVGVWGLLILVPGAAQALVGRRRAAAVVLGALVAYGAAIRVAAPLLYAYPLLWLAALLDGRRGVRRFLVARAAAAVQPPAPLPAAVIAGHAVRSDAPRWRPALGALALLASVVLHGALSATYQAVTIASSSMAPTLAAGDTIVVDELTPRLRAPRAGEVITFGDPCAPSRQMIARVVAGPGQTVEVRCGQLHVDGRAVPSRPVPGACTYADLDPASGGWIETTCAQLAETHGGRTYVTLASASHADGWIPRDERFEFPGAEPPPGCEAPEHHRPAGRVVGPPPGRDAPPSCALVAHYVVPPDHVFVMGDNRHNARDSRFFGAVPRAYVRGRALGIALARDRGAVAWARLGAID